MSVKFKDLKSRIIRSGTAIAVSVLLFLFFFGYFDSFTTNNLRDFEAEKRSGKKWAEKMDMPGLDNFYKVSDNLYRGAQPHREGFVQLKELGIKTIVNLRSFHSDRDEMGDRDFTYKHIYMKPWHPEKKEIIHFLRTLTEKKMRPVFVHCRHGSDRTGTMCAVYRMVVQGWGKDEAIEEMTKGGFGFHRIWWNLENYLRELDVENIRWEIFLERLNQWDEGLLITFE
jgi:protein tyrosine phosphatase (PTP) superfamily phosphohydrolase (DUF442 family)